MRFFYGRDVASYGAFVTCHARFNWPRKNLPRYYYYIIYYIICYRRFLYLTASLFVLLSCAPVVYCER